MQMFRKAAVSAVILGAGLASTAGMASAHESQPAQGGCSNAAAAENSNGAGRTLGDTTGGDQGFDFSNTCDLLNGNKVGSDNNTAMDGGTVTNGDSTTTNRSTESTVIDTVTTTLGL